MKNLFFLIWLFILIFLPQFIVGSVIFNTLYLLIIPVLLIRYTTFNRNVKNSRFLLLLILVIIYHLIVSLFNNFLELSIFKQLIIFPILFLNFYYFILKFKNYYKDLFFEKLFIYILLALTVNSIVLLLTVFSTDFSIQFYKFVYLTEKQYGGIFGDRIFRRYSGFSVSGFSYLSFKYMFLYLISIIYFSNLKTSAINNYKIIIMSLILILSLFFVARTGLIIVLLFFIYFLFKKYIYKLKLSLILFISIISYYFVTYTLSDQFGLAFERSFDLFINYYNNSDLTNDSLKDLSKEFILPDNFTQWLFGRGDFGRDSGLLTDIGWLSFINGAGIIGILVYYSIYVYTFLIALANKNSTLKNISISLILFSFFANFKDLVYLEHSYIQALIIILLILLWKD